MDIQFRYFVASDRAVRRVKLSKNIEEGNFKSFIVETYVAYINEIFELMDELDIAYFRDGVYFYGISNELLISSQDVEGFYTKHIMQIEKLEIVTNYHKRLLADKSQTVPLPNSDIFTITPMFLDRPELNSYSENERRSGEISLLITYALDETRDNVVREVFGITGKRVIKRDELNLDDVKGKLQIVVDKYFRTKLVEYINSF